MSSGLFITFEGIDGCGKTTQLEAARSFLEQQGVSCVVTREPGGTAIGRCIRSVLLSPEHSEMHNECELLLYFADRAQHVREVIQPALQQNRIVLCDRYADATMAYQGYGRGIPLSVLETQNALATGGLWPHITFFFDISTHTASFRLKETGKAIDRLEGSGNAFYEKVRSGYLSIAQQNKHRIRVLNGELPKVTLTSLVVAEIMKNLK
jgi:dTMP kinase